MKKFIKITALILFLLIVLLGGFTLLLIWGWERGRDPHTEVPEAPTQQPDSSKQQTSIDTCYSQY